MHARDDRDVDWHSQPFKGRNSTVCEVARKDAGDSSCKANSDLKLFKNERYDLICPNEEAAMDLADNFVRDGMAERY